MTEKLLQDHNSFGANIGTIPNKNHYHDRNLLTTLVSSESSLSSCSSEATKMQFR